MLSRKRLIFFCATACLVTDIKVEALQFPSVDRPEIRPPGVDILFQPMPTGPLFAPDTTTTRPKGSTSVNASTTKTASVSTSNIVSESNGVSTPTISTATTSHSTGNDKESSGRLPSAEVLLIVGLCIGVPLIIVIVALAVVIVRLKKQLREALLSPKANQTTSSKNQIQQPTVGDTGGLSVVTEGPYESLKPSRVSDGFYQPLGQSKKTDSAITSSDI